MTQLQTPVNELELQHDSDAVWRNYVNTQLREYYQPLYASMDYWLALQAPSFNCVYRWRLEQEQKLIAQETNSNNSKTMNSVQLLNFIQHFQRLTEHGINTLPQSVDAILYLDKVRKISKMACKSE